ILAACDEVFPGVWFGSLHTGPMPRVTIDSSTTDVGNRAPNSVFERGQHSRGISGAVADKRPVLQTTFRVLFHHAQDHLQPTRPCAINQFCGDLPEKQITDVLPLLNPENPMLVAAVTPKERYSQLAYQFACGGGYPATGPHDPAPEPKRIFLRRGAAKQRTALHAQCSKPLLENSPVAAQKSAPSAHVTPIGPAFKERLDCRVAHHSIRLREARQAADRHCAAPTKNRRPPLRKTLPQGAAVTQRQ